ncbi:hypothetical protein [Roseisolibacter sp. H3M3-2]|uniref:hypothetical protein n=1 Tax=Roseisolibacter sp. H3M3-2 TaxID=3031323 RepID=UPI0023DB3E1E|nr:hypothetical protein [Roseisolibacter sp. H3M3-2]MDF1502296.1 hypothetical protein [Roseisolibacter sp. H3M3-2]
MSDRYVVGAHADLLPRERRRGHGVLARGDATAPVSFLIDGSLHRPSERWDLEVTRAEPAHAPWLAVLDGDDAAPLTLRGRDSGGNDVLLPEVHAGTWTGAHMTGFAWDVRINCEPYPAALPEQYVSIYLTPTGLAVPRPESVVKSTSGEITRIPESTIEDRPDDNLSTAAGVARLTLEYRWERVDIDGVEADVRVPVPALHLVVADDVCAADPMVVMHAVDEAIADVLDVLSFLSRRYVRWTRMRFTGVRREGDRTIDYQVSKWRRTIGSSRPRRSRDGLMVLPGRMPSDALDHMLGAYRRREHRSLRAAIVYVLAAREPVHLESRFTSAFTAVEALLTATNAPDERPAGKRAADMFARAAVRWDDLWPGGTELEPALLALYKRRNLFVHEGLFPDVDHAHIGTQRLVHLCERMLFALMEGDTEWLAPRFGDAETAWLARQPV